MRALGLLVVLLSGSTFAEGSWLAARGRLLNETRVEAWVGTRSFGLGMVKPDAPGAAAGMVGEATWAVFDRVLELRGARQWQLTKARAVTLSTSLGATVFLVPEGQTDVGVGPHGTFTASFGGEVFSFDLSLQTGVEIFARGPNRLPQRVVAGFNLRLGDFTVALMGRAGADVMPGHNFVVRGEAMLAVGWLGLDALAAPRQ